MLAGWLEIRLRVARLEVDARRLSARWPVAVPGWCPRSGCRLVRTGALAVPVAAVRWRRVAAGAIPPLIGAAVDDPSPAVLVRHAEKTDLGVRAVRAALVLARVRAAPRRQARHLDAGQMHVPPTGARRTFAAPNEVGRVPLAKRVPLISAGPGPIVWSVRAIGTARPARLSVERSRFGGPTRPNPLTRGSRLSRPKLAAPGRARPIRNGSFAQGGLVHLLDLRPKPMCPGVVRQTGGPRVERAWSTCRRWTAFVAPSGTRGDLALRRRSTRPPGHSRPSDIAMRGAC